MTGIPQLDIAHLQRLLHPLRVGRHIRHETVCASTNDLAHAMLEGGAPSGTVVVAEEQTAGRGRFQRAWKSEAGQNLLFTVIVRWPRDGFAPTWLTLAAALSVRQAVEELFHLSPKIKWPNDVVLTLGDGVQKLAGVLTEATTLGPREQGAVVGVGLNVNQVWMPHDQDPERPRVSLASALGRRIDREPLLAGCLASFDEHLTNLSKGHTGDLVAEAQRHLTGIGRAAHVRLPNRSWRGILVGIDRDYHLLLRDEHGEPHCISAGEVLFGSQDLRGG
ncbi:biotin--[acetyl-CoA-carboxylase] ligase [Candidatus Sumerlaeota bacterium]|nr:biotin--[acetyl-CoA-carboxylase] ligase [Candidatus Sumerlaeota bacterium]